MILIWFNKPHDLTHFTPAYAFLVSTFGPYFGCLLILIIDLSYGKFLRCESRLSSDE